MKKLDPRYEAIIHLPHPDSVRHARMAVADRAAQFSAFAALTGYEAAVEETARVTENRVELDEDARAALDETLRQAMAQPAPGPRIRVTWFRPDERKEGGSYQTSIGRLAGIDLYWLRMLLTGGETIPLDDVREIAVEKEE